MFRLLFIGDVVGETGCAAVRALVPDLRRELGLDAVVANGENSAPEGRGITADSGSTLLSAVDFVTLGDHAFEAEGAEEYLDREPRVVRPANLDESRPGRGWGTFEAGDVRVGVANVQGRVLMQEDLRSPFEVADQAVADGSLRGRPRLGRRACRSHEREAGHGLSPGRQSPGRYMKSKTHTPRP